MNEKKCREIVLERALGRCEMTGESWGYFSYHHRLKRSQGGRWSPENVVYVTGSGTTGSHGFIESHPQAASESGFHVRPWENPADKPLLLHGKTWVKLNANGTYDMEDEGE